MLNRRHIRIKVMQSLYAFNGTESDDLTKDEKFLLHSIDSMYDLYLSILALLIAIHKKSKDYHQKLQNIHLATEDGVENSFHFANNHAVQVPFRDFEVHSNVTFSFNLTNLFIGHTLCVSLTNETTNESSSVKLKCQVADT